MECLRPGDLVIISIKCGKGRWMWTLGYRAVCRVIRRLRPTQLRFRQNIVPLSERLPNWPLATEWTGMSGVENTRQDVTAPGERFTLGTSLVVLHTRKAFRRGY